MVNAVFPSKLSLDDALVHYGVKGMRWGVRKERETSGNRRVSRRENRNLNKQAQDKFYTEKMNKIYKQAHNGGQGILVRTRYAGDPIHTITTGDIFARSVERGAMVDARHTEIHARKHKGKYVLNDKPIGTYQQRDFRKEQAHKPEKEANKKLPDGNLLIPKVPDGRQAAAKKKSGRKLTDDEKQLLIGIAAVGGIMAAKQLYKMQDAGEFARYAKKGKAFITGKQGVGKEIWKKSDRYTGKMSKEKILWDVIPTINESYGAPGTVNNCRRCTFAYELRRRGYDVSATKTFEGTGQSFFGLINAVSPGERTYGNNVIRETMKMVNDPHSRASKLMEEGGNTGLGLIQIPLKPTSFLDELAAADMGDHDFAVRQTTQRAQTIFDEIAKMPDGARGELGVSWMPGGAHSLAWEIIDGKPVIMDTQSSKMYSSPERFFDVAKDIGTAGITRLDNIDLNDDFLLKWVK